MTYLPLRVVMVAFLAGFGCSVGHAAEIVPLTGKPIQGTITSVDALFVTFQDAMKAEIKLPIKSLSAVELGPKAPTLADVSYDEIELTDGTVLRTPVRVADTVPVFQSVSTVNQRCPVCLTRHIGATEQHGGYKKYPCGKGR